MTTVHFTKRWKSARLATIFLENVKKNASLTSTDALQFRYGEIRSKPALDITDDLKDTYRKYTLVCPNDIMLNGLNLNYDFVTQRVARVETDGIITSAYICLRSREGISAQYYTYLLKTLDSMKVFNGMGTGIRLTLSYNLLKNLDLPVPPRDEQDQIVRYLDWQVSKINKLIAAKKKQIALLREQKQNRVNDIALHGINPTCKVKESGIEYIGTVPNHWLVLLNHRVFISVTRKFDEQETVLSLSQKDGLIPYEIMTERSLHTASYDNWQLVLENDLVLNRFKAHLGVFFASNYRGIVTFHYGVYSPRMPLLAKYYEALYHTPIFRCVYAGQSRGMTVGLQNLSDTNFFSTYTLYPPFDEQKLIVTEIEKIESQYVSIEKKITMSVDALQELRTRLISDVVTGQIDVRSVAVPEYEPVEEDISEVEFADDELETSEVEQP